MNKKRYTAEELILRKKESQKKYFNKPDVRSRIKEYNKIYYNKRKASVEK